MHNLIETLEWYCERIEKELSDLKSKLSKNETMLPQQDLDVMDKLLHSMKSVKTVLAMLGYDEESRYSGNYGVHGRNYSGSRYYEPQYMPRYSGEDYSGRMRMTGSGRGYSRDSENGESIRILESMMSRAKNEDEAMAIREAIDAVKSGWKAD